MVVLFFCLIFVLSIKTIETMSIEVTEVNSKLEAIGDLIKNGKVCSFAQFKQYANVHEYGRGRGKLFIIFVGFPKENMFAFYPPQTTKADALVISYEWLIDTYNTEMKQEFLDDNVMWGDNGIPLSYRGLR